MIFLCAKRNLREVRGLYAITLLKGRVLLHFVSVSDVL